MASASVESVAATVESDSVAATVGTDTSVLQTGAPDMRNPALNVEDVRVLIDSMSEDVKARVDECLFDLFVKALKDEWDKVWSVLPDFAKKDSQHVMEAEWRKHECHKILEKLLHEIDAGESRLAEFLKILPLPEFPSEARKQVSRLLLE